MQLPQITCSNTIPLWNVNTN